MNCIVTTSNRGALSARQIQVLTLYCRDGKTIKEIALDLEISVWMVRRHLYLARDVLGAETLAQTVYLATSAGLINSVS